MEVDTLHVVVSLQDLRHVIGFSWEKIRGGGIF